MPLASLPAQSWDVWWQWNRSLFLQPPAYGLADKQDEARSELVSLLICKLQDDDARVRVAALRALGKVAGSTATRHLLGMLDDASQEVREDAILALGSTGSSRAVHALMYIASYGRAPGQERETISRSARPLAVIALGLAQRYGAKTELDAFVRSLALDNTSAKAKNKTPGHLQRDLLMAKLLYATLVGSGAMRDTAHELVGAKKTAVELRSRALETLAMARDPGSLQVLTRSLDGHQLDARRSAALALGGFDSPKAVRPLRMACKSEHEQLTCAFLQVSLGHQGTDAARRILLENLRGRRVLRPWAAIGLGLLARQNAQKGRDDHVVNALRQAYRNEKNRSNRGAYLLALGLARDGASVHELAHVVRDAKRAQDRAAAGHALALIGPDVARPVVRSHLRTEPRHIARAVLAETLGYVGEPEDARLLISLFRKVGRANDLPQIARAIGMLPSHEAYLTMLGIVKSSTMPSWFRATAIDALGMMLSKHRRFHLAELAHNANFTAFPDWSIRVFQMDL